MKSSFVKMKAFFLFVRSFNQRPALVDLFFPISCSVISPLPAAYSQSAVSDKLLSRKRALLLKTVYFHPIYSFTVSCSWVRPFMRRSFWHFNSVTCFSICSFNPTVHKRVYLFHFLFATFIPPTYVTLHFLRTWTTGAVHMENVFSP